jgi:hypothetical protein
MASVTGYQSAQRRLLAGEGADGVMLEELSQRNASHACNKQTEVGFSKDNILSLHAFGVSQGLVSCVMALTPWHCPLVLLALTLPALQVWMAAMHQEGVDALQKQLYSDPELCIMGSPALMAFRLSR